MSVSIEAGLAKAIDAVVPKSWKHAKRHADVQNRLRPTALGRFRHPPANEVSIREAAFQFMEEAYLKASSGGTLPANARQIMYCARPLVIGYLRDAGCERTCWTKSSYFTQVLARLRRGTRRGCRLGRCLRRARASRRAADAPPDRSRHARCAAVR